MEASNVKPKRR